MRKLRITPFAVMLFAMTGSSSAAPNPQSAEQSPSAISSVHDTAYIKSGELLMMINNNGSFAYDHGAHFGKNDGLHYPGHCPMTVMYAAGLWIGAKVEGEIRVSAAEYSFDYTPGTMAGSLPTPDGPRFRVYKIRAGDSRLTNPDYAEWPFDDGAPALMNHNGGDSIDAEGYRIPLQLGDEAVWTVFNDADMAGHLSDPGWGSSGPLGLEIQLYSYAFDSAGSLGRIIFMDYTLINKGGNTLDSTHIAFWADPDLGGAGDDFVGSDTILDLGYCYNANISDAVYWQHPPAVGIGILSGPIVPAPGELAWQPSMHKWLPGFQNIDMTAFSKYINGTDPSYNLETWNYMRGLNSDGSIVIDPSNGQPTKFMVSGDPIAGTGWLDENAADRRMMLTTGPITLLPGDTQVVSVATAVGSSFPFDCLVSMFADTIHAEHTAGISDGRVFAIIAKPDSTVGHDYRITFTGPIDDIRWHLRDVTENQILFADQTNTSGEGDYPYVDGLVVKVIGASPGIAAWETPSGTRRFTWLGGDGFQMEGFNGAMGWNSPCHFFGPCDDPGVPVQELKRVLLKLAATDLDGNFDPDDPNLSYGYRYLRGATLPPAQPAFAPFILNSTQNYGFQAFEKSIPLSAWDMDADPPRRLVVGHLENNDVGGMVDGKYWPPFFDQGDNVVADGPREWLWIFDADYSESVDPAFTGSALMDPLPIMYMSTAALRLVPFEAGDEFLIIPTDSSDYFSDAEIYSFTSPMPSSGLAGADDSMDRLASIADLRHLDSVAQAKFEETHWACACPCFADPACGGEETTVFDVFDIVGFIDVAFRNASPVHDRPCPTVRTDVNCTGATDIVDVVSAIDVAFRNIDPAQRFCNPCILPSR